MLEVLWACDHASPPRAGLSLDRVSWEVAICAQCLHLPKGVSCKALPRNLGNFGKVLSIQVVIVTVVVTHTHTQTVVVASRAIILSMGADKEDAYIMPSKDELMLMCSYTMPGR